MSTKGGATGSGIVGRHWIERGPADQRATPGVAPPAPAGSPPADEEALALLDEVLAAHDADRPWSPVTTAAIRDVVARWRGRHG